MIVMISEASRCQLGGNALSFLFCYDFCVCQLVILRRQSELSSVTSGLMLWAIYVLCVVSTGSESENLLSICLYEPVGSYLLCYAVEMFGYPHEFLYG